MTIPPVPPPSGSSISEGDFQETFRIDRIIKLIILLIETLQTVAVTQAQRLQFLTEWQKTYTALMDKVPIFTESGDTFGGDSDEEVNVRDDMNRLNSTYTEQLRSQRSQIGDDAKALQTNLSQSNDAVVQQANMATALLQQLSTILSTLYR